MLPRGATVPSSRLRIPAIIRVTLVSAAVAFSAPTLAAAIASKSPSLRCSPAVVQADDDFAWRMILRVDNPLHVALVADSAHVKVEDLSHNQTQDELAETLPLSRLIAMPGTIEPGTSKEVPWRAPASIEEGKLVPPIVSASKEEDL
jgi:hypothetical protein